MDQCFVQIEEKGPLAEVIRRQIQLVNCFLFGGQMPHSADILYPEVAVHNVLQPILFGNSVPREDQVRVGNLFRVQ